MGKKDLTHLHFIWVRRTLSDVMTALMDSSYSRTETLPPPPTTPGRAPRGEPTPFSGGTTKQNTIEAKILAKYIVHIHSYNLITAMIVGT